MKRLTMAQSQSPVSSLSMGALTPKPMPAVLDLKSTCPAFMARRLWKLTVPPSLLH
jgi:hypothetical protein